MAIVDQSGFDAIQPTVPQAPYAQRKIVRGPDGTPQVVLVDMAGNVINDPTGYGIVESGNYFNPQGTGIGTVTIDTNNPKPESQKNMSTAQSVIQGTTRGEKSDSEPGSGNYGRGASDNYGYIDKPGFVGLAGALPGPLGLAGKAVNMGINANNAKAVSDARSMLGLPGLGIGGAVKSTLRDNKGQVADVTFGDSTYATPVGFEALSPDGMTNMTPAEAQARARAVGGIQLATKEEIAARDAAFQAEFDKPGIFGRITQTATNFVDNLFGSKPSYQNYDPVAHAKITSQNSGSNFKPTDSGFADMIGASKKGSSSSGGQRSSSSSASNPGTSGNMGSGGGTTSGHGPGIGSA